MHAPQDVKLAAAGPLGIGHRIVGGGRLGQSRQHRRLGDAQLQRLAEVDRGGRGETVGPLAQESLVDIQLEDFILGEVGLDLVRKHDLTEACE